MKKVFDKKMNLLALTGFIFIIALLLIYTVKKNNTGMVKYFEGDVYDGKTVNVYIGVTNKLECSILNGKYVESYNGWGYTKYCLTK